MDHARENGEVYSNSVSKLFEKSTAQSYMVLILNVWNVA